MINHDTQEILSGNVVKFIDKIGQGNTLECIAMYSAADASNKYLVEINGMLKRDKEKLERKIGTVMTIMDDIKNKDIAYRLMYIDFFKTFIPNWNASASQSLRHAQRNAENWAEGKFGDGYKNDLRKSQAITNYILKVLRETSGGKWVLENKYNEIVWRNFTNILQEWVKLMFFREGTLDIDNM